ncbi:hypothetical protein B0H63DRAFT_559372 [Podospora didyma]|uniref:Uncharacterized protein n=1 Tax=Podospora didyma TaxID=330526 RepID=A0AAE0NUI5_9PEZI|nr:hypothetical protein B0H63DRAFT_559372 [Podospora didyma]
MSPNDNLRQKASFEDSVRSSDDESGMTLLGEHMQLSSPKKRSRFHIILRLLLAATALVCGVSIVYTAFAVHSISLSSTTDFGDCGTQGSVEEARAKGCKFDPMSWIWVRPECYNADLIADFMNRTEFSWHTEPKLKPESRVPLDVVFRGDHPKLFTQKQYHLVHCAYMSKKLLKSIIDHTPIDDYLVSWKHEGHCEMVLLNDYLHEDVVCEAPKICPTHVQATWTTCKRY